METPTSSRRFLLRNMPRLSRTPGSTTPIARPLPKEVFLHEWWLVRADTPSNGKNLQVSGYTYRGQVKQKFHSAPIMKRHGADTLETEDGITVSTLGLINKLRTFENGFSKEVCEIFLLGFPFNWEEFASVPVGVSSSEMNPHSSEIRGSSNYTLPVAFEDSENSMVKIVVESIQKSFAGTSCTGGKMTDCLKEDASHGMKDSFTRENLTSNAVYNENTVTHVVPVTTSSVARRVKISQKPEDGITKEGAACEKSLEVSCVDSHASAGVEGNMNTASEDLEFSCADSHASEANSQTVSAKEGHMGSLVEDFKGNKIDVTESEGNDADLFGDLVASQSCNKSKQTSVNQKKRGGPPANDMSNMRMTRSMKRLRNISLEDTLATTDGITEAVVLETPKKQSHAVNTSSMADGVVLGTPKKQFHAVNTSAMADGLVLETPNLQSHVMNTSTPTDGFTASVVLETPKKQFDILLARCQVTEKVEKSHKMPTLRRSSRGKSRGT